MEIKVSKKQTFAVISKNDCCTGWKNSYFVANYEIDGKMMLPDWEAWCKDSNAPHLTSSQELKSSLIEDEDEKGNTITGKYVVVDYRNVEPYTCFEQENDAIAYLWDCYHGDWHFELFTQEEAIEWLQKQISLKRLYGNYVEDYLLDEDNDLEDIQGFLQYTFSSSTSAGSKSYNLAGLALFGSTWVSN